MSAIAVEESSTVTGWPVYRLKHKWTVNGFAVTYLAHSRTNKENHPERFSEWFSSLLDSQLEFRVGLRPRGWTKEDQDSLGLFLEIKGGGPSTLAKSVDVKFKFSLVNERKEECHSRDVTHEFVYPWNNWGWNSFLKHSVLLDPAKGLLPADTLTILAEIDVCPKPVIQLGHELLLEQLKVASIESVRASHADLLDSGEHGDVRLVVNGQEYPAHRALLSAVSPVFSAMFKAGMSEVNKGKVMIPDLENEAAYELLRFIYSGEVEDLQVDTEELLVAADKYDVSQLKALCSQYLCGQVATENVARLLALADRHSVAQLKSVTVEYIRAHWEDVMTRPLEWKSVQDLFIEELCMLKLKEEGEMEKGDKPEEEKATPTVSPVYRLKHKWTVKGFASIYLADSTEMEEYPRLYSAWFACSLDCQTRFRLCVRPRGRSSESQNNLDLYLEMKRSRHSLLAKSVDINIKFSLLNERNQECHSQEFRREFNFPWASWGMSPFLKRSQLESPANGLLPADTLTILAEIDVYPKPVSQQSNESLLAKLAVASIETVRASQADLLASGEHSDVILLVDGQEYPAHKALLAAVSPVFRLKFSAMFMSAMSEDQVIIPDMKEEVAKQLLHFIYKGEVEDLAVYAEELLVAADKYDVTHLKALCSQYLCGQVATENVARLLAFAQRHSVAQLKTVTVEYIRAHMEDVLTRPNDWKPVQDLFIEELCLLKLKEGEDTKKEGKAMSQEESESTN